MCVCVASTDGVQLTPDEPAGPPCEAIFAMLYSQIKRELLDMFHADTKVLEREVEKMNPKMRAILRTTRLGDREMQPGEDAALIRRTGRGKLGKGLFANKDFEKGEFITSFPIDCTLYKDDDGKTKVCYGSRIDMDALETQGSGNAILANRKFAHLVSDSGMPLSMAMPTPVADENGDGGSDDSPYYWGHWADDAACLNPRAANARRAEKEYADASFAEANATHIMVANGIFVWTVATRKIAKGDEIFVTHGTNWWRSWNAMQAVADEDDNSNNAHARSSEATNMPDADHHASSDGHDAVDTAHRVSRTADPV